MLFIILFLLNFSLKAETSVISVTNPNSLYIVDGDSISLKMRIRGIDTPEISQKCQKNKGVIIDCGELTKKYLKKKLNNSKHKLIIKFIAIDYYHRILVDIYKDDINIGRQMVLNGMAFAYGEKYKKVEKLAQANNNGLWQFYQPPIKPQKWRRTNRAKH